jgi:hypothetical protein
VLLACTGTDPVIGSEGASGADAGSDGSGLSSEASVDGDGGDVDGGEPAPVATGTVVFTASLIADKILANAVAFDESGGVFVGGGYLSASVVDFGNGKSLPANAAFYDGFIAKYDASGNCLWVVALDGVDDGAKVVVSLAVAPGGDIVFGASSRASSVHLDKVSVDGFGSEDIVVGRLDTSGAQKWLRVFGGGGADSLQAIAVDATGRTALTGSYVRNTATDIAFDGKTANPPIHEMPCGIVALLDANGIAQSMKAFPAPSGDPLSSQIYPHDVAFASDGIVVGGHFQGRIELRHGEGATTQVVSSAGSDDGFLAKIDGANKIAWAITVGATGSDNIKAIAVDPTSGDIRAAFTYGVGTTIGGVQLPVIGGYTDIGIARFDANGGMGKGIGYGSLESELPTRIAIDRWGQTIVSGGMLGAIDFGKVAASYGGLDGFVAKLSPTNTGLWAYGIGGSGAADQVNAVAVDKNGNVAAAGTMEGEGIPKALFGKTVNVAPGKNGAFLVVTTP